ncbi:PadR family transcriptional regulator [Micromonospora sp. WMMD723]|uniref:PadR family transcriptional regulator n=1 Tax=Micromonospora sp. WMMD723 TaxID=3403465 RepID=UPI003CF7136D
MTLATQRVLQVLLDKPAEEKYGLEICEGANLASGTIHPILARLEKVGWLESRWENVDPHRVGRPRRRYYRLSPDGAQQARAALAAVEARSYRSIGVAFPGGVA